VRQLIARIDDDLHRRLKERAADEGRSVNSLVQDALEERLGDETPRQRLRRQIEAAGLTVNLPPVEGEIPSLEEAIEIGRGWGTAVSDALEADRDGR